MIELRSSVMVGEEIMRRGVNLRILYLTQFFDPEPAYKGLGFAKGLQSAGHAVSVLTGFPNYPGGKIYDGYRIRLVQHEVMQGVAVARVPLYPSHDKSAWRRLLNYATFAMSSTLYGLFRAGRCDVIYVYHPPMTAGLAAVLVGLLRRRPVVIDIQDLWPDTLAATGMIRSPRILKIVAFACNFTYRHATRISVQSPGFKQRLVERGVPSDKIDVILNWADIGETTPKHALDLTPFALDDRFNVLFAGTMGMAQGLDVILDAAKIVATSDSRIQFLLVGSGVETGRLQRRIQTEFAPQTMCQRMVALMSA